MHNNLSEFSIGRGASLLDAAEAISRNRSRCVLVADGAKVIGIVSEGDLVRALLGGAEIHAPLESFVHHAFKFLRHRDFKEALRLMHIHGITLVPILDNEFSLIDVITLPDLLSKVALIEDD